MVDTRADIERIPMHYPLKLFLFSISIFITGIAVNSPGLAAQFTISKTADTADGVCDADCSLREAIIAANTNGEDDILILPIGTYSLTRNGAGENESATGDLDITSPLTLTGAAEELTIIDGAGLDRIFHIRSSNLLAPAIVSLSDLTVQNGFVDGDAGGGIRAEEDTQLTLTNVTVQTNRSLNSGSASGMGVGGGIYNNGVLKFNSGVIANNQSDANSGEGRAIFGGGGLINDTKGDGTLIGVTIRGNSANNSSSNTALRFATGGGALNLGTLFIRDSVVGTRDPAAGAADRNISLSGGGLSNVGGVLTVLKSAVAFNETYPAGVNEGRNGGGIYHQNAGSNLGKLILTGASVHNNTSAVQGGGVFAAGAPITVSNSAVYRNSAGFLGGGFATAGNVDSDITNTTIAENQAVQGGGIITSNSFNIVSSTIHNNIATEAGSQVYIRDPRAVAPESTRPDVVFTSTIISHGNADPATNCLIPPAAAGDNAPNDNFVKSGRFNIDTGSSCRLTDPTDLVAVDPLLDPVGLVNNTDPNDPLAAPSIATQPGSRARERADLVTCPGNDQRFFRRQGLCDVGAYEADGVLSAATTSDLEVRVREQADVVYAGFGQQATYTVTVLNKGPDEVGRVVMSGVVTFDDDNNPSTPPATLPAVARISVVEGDARDAQCAALAAPALGFRCEITRLTPSRFISVAIAVDTPNPGSLEIRAEATTIESGADPFLPNNSATERSTVKSAGEAPPTVDFPRSEGGGGVGLTLILNLFLLSVVRMRNRRFE